MQAGHAPVRERYGKFGHADWGREGITQVEVQLSLRPFTRPTRLEHSCSLVFRDIIDAVIRTTYRAAFNTTDGSLFWEQGRQAAFFCIWRERHFFIYSTSSAAFLGVRYAIERIKITLKYETLNVNRNNVYLENPCTCTVCGCEVVEERHCSLVQTPACASSLGARKLDLAARKRFLPTSRAVNTHHLNISCRSTQPVMLRASLRSSRALGYKPSVAIAGRQWHAVQAGRVASGSWVRAFEELDHGQLKETCNANCLPWK